MYAISRRRGPTLFGCLGILVVTLLVGFLVVGWFRNWYDFSGRDDAQQLEMGVRIHKEEVERDFGRVRDETQRLTESAQVAAEMETIEGTVSAVSATQLTVQVGQREHIVIIDEVTKFLVDNQEVDLKSIQQGDQVRVVYQASDGQKRASRVTVLEEEQP